MTLTMRAYQSEDDYWRWHVNANIVQLDLPQVIFLWETAQGQIAAVLNPEGKQEAFLQVHPELRTAALEQEMLAVAERELIFSDAQGERKFYVWAEQVDGLRQEMQKARGYTRFDAQEHQRRGLGKALMLEGMRRLKRLGATLATVNSYSPPAGALYESAGFTDYDLSEAWVKQL